MQGTVDQAAGAAALLEPMSRRRVTEGFYLDALVRAGHKVEIHQTPRWVEVTVVTKKTHTHHDCETLIGALRMAYERWVDDGGD